MEMNNLSNVEHNTLESSHPRMRDLKTSSLNNLQLPYPSIFASPTTCLRAVKKMDLAFTLMSDATPRSRGLSYGRGLCMTQHTK